MKRLVYSPKVNAYVKCDQGVIDLSPYIVDCTINRKVNQVSTAMLTFRNPNFVFTNSKYTDPDNNTTIQPVIHPMDPIIITMTRLRDRPILMFTGYCDKTPYIQLYPGLAHIEASCTLKRLQYTYWDPGLPFVRNFLSSYGWQPNEAAGGIANWKEEGVALKKINNLSDSSIGDLLFAVLQYVGGWDTSTIFIDKLPPTIGQTVAKIFDQIIAADKQAQKEFEDLLHNMIGTSSFGNGGASSGNSKDFGNTQVPRTVYCVGKAMSVPDIFLLTAMAVGLQECGGPGAKTFNNCTDGKSVGWRQETAGGDYDLSKAMDVRHTATQFYNECQQHYRAGMSVAELGQAVQRAGADTLATQMASGNPQKLLDKMKQLGCGTAPPTTAPASPSAAGNPSNVRAGQ